MSTIGKSTLVGRSGAVRRGLCPLLVAIATATTFGCATVPQPRAAVPPVVLDERETGTIKTEVAAAADIVHDVTRRVLAKRGFAPATERERQHYLETSWNSIPKPPRNVADGFFDGLAIFLQMLTFSYSIQQTMMKVDVNACVDSTSIILTQAIHRNCSGSFFSSRPTASVEHRVTRDSWPWDYAYVDDLMKVVKSASEFEMRDRLDPPPGGPYRNRFGTVQRRAWRGDGWWVEGP